MREIKKKIRKNVIEKRNELSEKYRKDGSIKIWGFLYKSLEFKYAKHVFMFLNFGSEVETISRVEEVLKENKKVYVPKIVGKEMRVIEIDSLDNLEKNKIGILEPKINLLEKDLKKDLNLRSNKGIEEIIDLIVVPGVAFDEVGYRVGYGGGYYDKFMSKANLRANKIGIGFEVQVIKNKEVPREIWDIKLDYLITEEKIRKFKN